MNATATAAAVPAQRRVQALTGHPRGILVGDTRTSRLMPDGRILTRTPRPYRIYRAS